MTLKKFTTLFIFFLLGFGSAKAQTFGFVEFSKLPVDKQLYGRESNNEGVVPIAGKVNERGYSYLSVIKYRNNTCVEYRKIPLAYGAGNSAAFETSMAVKAELAEYAFEVYACKSASDSALVVRRNDVVAGDFYIVYGQSNAVAWEVDYDYRNEFCRSYGFSWDHGTTFGLSNAVSPRAGIFAIEFQRRVAEMYQIPTCVISGAAAGASVFDLSARNPDNPGDGGTIYGRLYASAAQTGLMPYLKAIFYWQGEAEAASEDPMKWAPQFDVLVKNLQKDYPAVEKIYVFQLPLFGGGAYDDRIGLFREQQRTLDRKYPIVQPYAALGAPSWDGFHYGLDGYLRVGLDLALMAGHNHYGKKEKISSPSFQKAFYSNAEQDEITIVFEDYQEMVYPKDSTYANIEGSQEPYSTYRVKDFFYLNKEWQKLESGRGRKQTASL